MIVPHVIGDAPDGSVCHGQSGYGAPYREDSLFDQRSTPKMVLAVVNPQAEFFAGHDSAIVGIVWPPGLPRPVALYDEGMLLDSIVATRPEWTPDDAFQWLYENLTDSDDSPAIVSIEDDDEDDDATFSDDEYVN